VPRIRITLEDDQGNPLPDAQRTYPLAGVCDTIDQIERAVETFKERALPEVERSLLAQAQQRFVANARGENRCLGTLRLNGTERVRVKTIHGSFEFTERRFVLADGSSSHYLRRTGQDLVSTGLRELCLYYSNRLSFAEVAALVERVSGERLACKQTLCNWAREKAREVSAALRSEVGAARSLALPAVDGAAVDIYDTSSEEILVMSDAIQVKAQKPTRERAGRAPKRAKTQLKNKRVSTDLLLLEGRGGSFRCLSGGLDGEEEASLAEVARAQFKREWGEHARGPLPVVAITDGARSIRSMLKEIFGPSVRVILDWYHLAKRTYELLSMVAHEKAEREQMEGRVLSLLWRGGVSEALSYLGGVSARREEALVSLVGYLANHTSEIVDYERRAKAGKVRGSGRMEKTVDQAVGVRQKKKGMSWSESGSRALSVLKVVELNGEWERLWEATPVAA
jgi:hypothetical protein